MLVRSLEVQNFRIIRQAHLTFGRGLNVLFGPNDLGKSSLLDALRAAFLLPFTSKEGEEYIPWGNSDKPRVVVRFEASGTLWQITKEFGAGAKGTAILERFGENEIPLEKVNGRAVEDRLRQILAWGLPSAGQTRGLTETYLTTALLGHQDNVTRILAENIENDGSGRDLVTKALGALGQDPLVNRLLKELEERYDEAFTPAGGWKKSGPAAKYAREIEEHKDCLKELEERVCQSKGIEQKVMSLTEKRNLAIEVCSLLQQRLERLQKAKEAEEDLKRVRGVENARCALEATDNDLAEKNKIKQDATLAFEKLDAELRTAEDRRNKASGAAEEIRKSAQQTREARRAKLVARRETAAARVQSAPEAIQATEQIHNLAEALIKAKVQRDNREGQESNVKGDLKKAETELANAEAILASAQKDAARKEILRASLGPAKIAEQNATQTFSNAKAVIHLSERLAEADKSLAKLLEEEEDLEVDLKTNAVEKQSCETKGPRSLTIPIRAALLALLIGGTAAAAIGIALQFRAIILFLWIFGCALLAGGLAAFILWHRNRQKANQVWRQELNGLEKNRQRLVERKNQVSLNKGMARMQADNLRSQQDQLMASVANLTLEAAKERHQEAKKEVERIQSELQTLASGLIPVEEAERNVRSAKKAVSESQQKLDEARNELTKAQGRVEILEVQLSDANSKFEELAAKMGGKAAAQVLAEAEQERAEVEKGLKELEEAPHSELQAAEQELNQAQTAVTRLRAEVGGARTVAEAAIQAREQARRNHEEARVKHQTLLQSTPAGKEAKAAEEALAQARAELEKVSAPSLPQNLEETKALFTQRQAELRKAENDLHVARGELNQVGGIVAKEQRDQEREALERLEKSWHELEIEFKATKRLWEVLKEEEEKHGADLGRCLAQPVTESFLQLTNSGRYSQVNLEPQLGFRHVEAMGGERPLPSLSVGTREQLATLIRLTLAAHLKSVVVLDDQLAQSDSDRLLWFRDRLRASVRDHAHQIIVITCRPRDYLREEEIPAAPKGKFESEDGLLIVVDLKRVVS